jgi:hypothetical protein
MPSARYAFVPGDQQRVGVSWEGMWKSVAVTLDDRPLGAFADGKELQRGGRYVLADGSVLEVSLVQLPFPELRLLRDGVPLPGSPSDPQQLMQGAGRLITAIGVLSVALGLVAAAFDVGFLRGLGFGLVSALAAALFAALGVPAARGSLPAMAAAVALYVLDTLFSVGQLAQAGGTFPVGVPIARILFLIPMLRGLQGALALRQGVAARRPAPPTTSAAATGRTPPAAAARGPAAAGPAAPRLEGTASERRRELEIRGREVTRPNERSGAQRAAAALRFVAPKLELHGAGLRVISLDGRKREIRWDRVREVLVRRLPPDPPWSGSVLFDVVVADEPPLRILPATVVNFAALPGGAAPSRVENLRRLGRLLLERSPSVQVDPATRVFLGGTGQPSAFATLDDFARHDARLG